MSKALGRVLLIKRQVFLFIYNATHNKKWVDIMSNAQTHEHTQSPAPRLPYSINTAADDTGLSRSRIYKLINDGQQGYNLKLKWRTAEQGFEVIEIQ